MSRSLSSRSRFDPPAVIALLVLKRDYAGKRLTLKELERRPSSRGYVRHLVTEAHLLHRGRRVAAANDRYCPGACERLRDCARTVGELRELEYAHRAIPDDGGGVGNRSAEFDDRFWSDIGAFPVGGNVMRANDFCFAPCVAYIKRISVCYYHIVRQQDFIA